MPPAAVTGDVSAAWQPRLRRAYHRLAQRAAVVRACTSRQHRQQSDISPVARPQAMRCGVNSPATPQRTPGQPLSVQLHAHDACLHALAVVRIGRHALCLKLMPRPPGRSLPLAARTAYHVRTRCASGEPRPRALQGPRCVAGCAAQPGAAEKATMSLRLARARPRSRTACQATQAMPDAMRSHLQPLHRTGPARYVCVARRTRPRCAAARALRC